MKVENLSTLKIHKLSQEQYNRELEAGRIDENAIYLTPDTNDLSTDTEIKDYIETFTEQYVDSRDAELKSYVDGLYNDLDANKVNSSAFNTLSANVEGMKTTNNYAYSTAVRLDALCSGLSLSSLGGMSPNSSAKVTTTSNFGSTSSISNVEGGKCYTIVVLINSSSTTEVLTFPLYVPLPDETSNRSFSHYHQTGTKVDSTNNTSSDYLYISSRITAATQDGYWEEIRFSLGNVKRTDISKITYIIM